MNNTEDSTPRIPIEEIGTTWTEVYTKLMTGNGLPERPFWLELSSNGFKITEDNRDAISLGMLLGLSMRTEGLR